MPITIVTDFGEFPLPPDIDARFISAKKTKRGRLDKRTREGRALMRWEANFIGDQIIQAQCAMETSALYQWALGSR